MIEKHVFQRGGRIADQLCGKNIGRNYACNQPADAPIHQMGDTQRTRAVSNDTQVKQEAPERVQLWICCHCQRPRTVGLTYCDGCHKQLHDTIEYSRVTAPIVAPVVDEQWVALLASAISTAEPTLMPERGNSTHYVIASEAFAGLVQIHRAIAKHLWGNPSVPASTVAPVEQSDGLARIIAAGRRWRDARTAYMTGNAVTNIEYGLAGDALAELITQFDNAPAPPVALTCAECGHESLFSDEGKTVCHKPVRTLAAKDKSTAETHADDFTACACKCVFPSPVAPKGHTAECDVWIYQNAACTCAPVAIRDEAEDFAHRVVGTVFDNTAASHETLKQTMIERIADSVTPPSTAAKAAAEEVIALVKKEYVKFDALSLIDKVAAIIERCLFAEREDQKSTPTGL